MNESDWIPSNAKPKQLIAAPSESHIFNLKAKTNSVTSVATQQNSTEATLG
jgi:hypothetical protein